LRLTNGRWFSFVKETDSRAAPGVPMFRGGCESKMGIMGSRSSAWKARVSNRPARHLMAAPHRLPVNQPMVSFTFDDVPESAATVGAPMLKDFHGHGTFYVAGSLVNTRRLDQAGEFRLSLRLRRGDT
jgi:hypothetical protein